MGKSNMEAAAAEQAAVNQTAEQAPGKDTVRILLPLSRAEKDDVFVGLNGNTYLIKRGEEVEVPAGVAEILRHREEMLLVGMAFEAEAAGEGAPK